MTRSLWRCHWYGQIIVQGNYRGEAICVAHNCLTSSIVTSRYVCGVSTAKLANLAQTSNSSQKQGSKEVEEEPNNDVKFSSHSTMMQMTFIGCLEWARQTFSKQCLRCWYRWFFSCLANDTVGIDHLPSKLVSRTFLIRQIVENRCNSIE